MSKPDKNPILVTEIRKVDHRTRFRRAVITEFAWRGCVRHIGEECAYIGTPLVDGSCIREWEWDGQKFCSWHLEKKELDGES